MRTCCASSAKSFATSRLPPCPPPWSCQTLPTKRAALVCFPHLLGPRLGHCLQLWRRSLFNLAYFVNGNALVPGRRPVQGHGTLLPSSTFGSRWLPTSLRTTLWHRTVSRTPTSPSLIFKSFAAVQRRCQKLGASSSKLKDLRF